MEMIELKHDRRTVIRWCVYNICTWLALCVLWIIIVVLERLGFSQTWFRGVFRTTAALGPLLFALAGWFAIRTVEDRLLRTMVTIGSGLLGVGEVTLAIVAAWLVKQAIRSLL